MSDLISRQAVKLAIVEKGQASRRYKLGETWELNREEAWEAIDSVPSAQPEYFDYTDIDEAWEYYAQEHDANLTDNAKQLKDAMWVGYQKGKQDAQPEQRWIPCSERLPEENIKVLVTDEDGFIDVAYYYYSEWSEDPKIEWWAGGFRAYPIAWMPLPEPARLDGES